jgi:hypothetical protein
LDPGIIYAAVEHTSLSLNQLSNQTCPPDPPANISALKNPTDGNGSDDYAALSDYMIEYTPAAYSEILRSPEV